MKRNMLTRYLFAVGACAALTIPTRADQTAARPSGVLQAAPTSSKPTRMSDDAEARRKEAEAKRRQEIEADKKDKTARASGATQLDATEGYLGEWVSNGIWKMRVTKFEAIESKYDAGRMGWGVTIEYTNINAKKKTLSLFNTGAAGKPILADAGGEPMSVDEGDWQTGAYFKDVLPAQTRTWQIKYFYAHGEKASEGPERLILEFDPKSGNLRDMGVKFNVADPSFRVFLTEREEEKKADEKDAKHEGAK